MQFVLVAYINELINMAATAAAAAAGRCDKICISGANEAHSGSQQAAELLTRCCAVHRLRYTHAHKLPDACKYSPMP